jgi:hypothetical protein
MDVTRYRMDSLEWIYVTGLGTSDQSFSIWVLYNAGDFLTSLGNLDD